MALGKGQCFWDVNASSYCIEIVFSNVKDRINHLTTSRGIQSMWNMTFNSCF